MRSIVLERSKLKERLFQISVFVLFLIISNNDIGNISRVIYWGGILLPSLIIFFISYEKNRNVEINSFFAWFFAFFLWSIISLLYSIDQNNSIQSIKSLMVNFVVLMFIMWSIRSKEELINVIKIYVATTIFNSIYLMLTVDWTLLGDERLSVEAMGEGWNANGVGMTMMWGVLLCYYLVKTLGQKRYYFAMLLFIPLIIYSGSRKVWLGIIVVALMMIYLNNKKNLFKALIISIIVLISVYYLVINVEFLYNIGGQRIEQLINGLSGQDAYDSSSEKRLMYIELGIKWFNEKPLLGYGLDSYRVLLSNSFVSHNTYSHNNYIELLVGLGIIGLIIFYSIYVILIYKCLKVIFKSGGIEKTQAFIWVSMLVLMVILHYGAVSYMDSPHIMLLLFAYKQFQLKNKQENRYEQNTKSIQKSQVRNQIF